MEALNSVSFKWAFNASAKYSFGPLCVENLCMKASFIFLYIFPLSKNNFSDVNQLQKISRAWLSKNSSSLKGSSSFEIVLQRLLQWRRKTFSYLSSQYQCFNAMPVQQIQWKLWAFTKVPWCLSVSQFKKRLNTKFTYSLSFTFPLLPCFFFFFFLLSINCFLSLFSYQPWAR